MHVCRECGFRAAKWLGRCPGCATWDSFDEQVTQRRRTVRAAPSSEVELQPYPEVESACEQRNPTGVAEFDRVLGGGLIPGGVILLAGEPGIGKSTLLLQAASSVAERGGLVLYASGEESAAQLRGRGDRLGVRSERLLVATETDVDALLDRARRADLALLALDSVQAVRCTGVDSIPGSLSQVREAASRVVNFAKSQGVPVVLVGHVTKDGSIAGPRALEHVVDTVIQFEGDRHHEHRMLRTLKNRFGPADELGVLRMTPAGLVGVPNPSELFLTDRPDALPGSAVLAGIEGTRPLLVEVQALVGEPSQGSPRRTSLGIDPNRVALVLAVLQRRARLDLANRDVFVNITGGLAVTEPAVDLAVAVAVASSALSRPLPPDCVFAGEIGLTGEVRAVSRAGARWREAQRLGFASAVAPRRGNDEPEIDGFRLRSVAAIDEAFRLLFD